jgi:hypothetical protein
MKMAPLVWGGIPVDRALPGQSEQWTMNNEELGIGNEEWLSPEGLASKILTDFFDVWDTYVISGCPTFESKQIPQGFVPSFLIPNS